MASTKAPVARPSFTELGTSGLQLSGGVVYQDLLPKLHGTQGALVYREMGTNDPVLAAILYVLTAFTRQVEWKVEPKDKSADAMEAAEFVEEVLFKDMSHPFSDFICEVCSMYMHGFSLFELVWKVRNGMSKAKGKSSLYDDQKIGVRRLAPRSQLTIWSWNIDEEGDLESVTQVTDLGANSDIPVEKLLHFRTISKLNNPEGQSVIRPCYVPYVRKKTIEDAEGRAALRSAGVVDVAIPSEYMLADADDDQKAIYQMYKSIATSLSQDRQGSIVTPSDRDDKGNRLFEVSYIVADSTRAADMTPIVERMDKRMLMTALCDFLLLGQQSTGSFALSSDKTNLFATSLGGYLMSIAEVLNTQLLPKLWSYNGMDPDIMPALVHGDVETVDLTALSSFITALAAAGAPLFPNPVLEQWMIRQFGGPTTGTESTDVNNEEKPTPVPVTGPNAVAAPGSPAAQANEAAAAAAEAKAKAPAPQKVGKSVPMAFKWLQQAIDLHEKHMRGEAPTTGPRGEKSQQDMMNMMDNALAELKDQ